jgi:hypothetical protein
MTPAEWKSYAHTNPQGAVLHYLKEETRPGSIGLTATELATELSMPLSRVRRQLRVLSGVGAGLIAQRGVMTRSGARWWYYTGPRRACEACDDTGVAFYQGATRECETPCPRCAVRLAAYPDAAPTNHSPTEGRQVTRIMYMHTVDGKPGHWDGEQIAFAHQLPHWQDEPAPVQVYAQLRTLMKHVAQSTRFRRHHNWDVPKYGWCVVKVPS